MTLTPANAKKMLFTLRYPPDKILRTFEGSFTATGSSSPFGTARRTHAAFNHNLGGQAYLQLRYSSDGGTTWQDQHVSIPEFSGGFPNFQTLEVAAYCTSTQIVVVASNWTGSNTSVMYEVVAFAKPGVTYSDIPTVTTGASKFTLSTRFNIQKIYLDDSVTISVPNGSSEQTIVTHSLNYVPSVRLFYTPVTGELWPFSPNQYTNIDGGPGTALDVYGNPVVTSSVLKVRVVNGSGSSKNVTFDYRVYLDE